VATEAGKLACVAPRFEGPAEVIGAIWSQVAALGEISILQSETGLTLDDPHPGVRHARSVRARNAGGTSRTLASEPVTATITGQ
jgi:hypothetical protein